MNKMCGMRGRETSRLKLGCIFKPLGKRGKFTEMTGIGRERGWGGGNKVLFLVYEIKVSSR